MSMIYFFPAETLRFFIAQRKRRADTVAVTFQGRQSVKHLFESIGIPHCEVGRIMLNGTPSTAERIAEDKDQIELQAAAGAPPFAPRFVLDCHLGRLTALLRMLGYDSFYRNDLGDDEAVAILTGDERILLTRDRRLLMRKVVQLGYCPRSLNPADQLREVVRRFELQDFRPCSRCLRCNTLLEQVGKESILSRLEPLTARYFETFSTCRSCRRIFWQGSHYDHMLNVVNQLRADSAQRE